MNKTLGHSAAPAGVVVSTDELGVLNRQPEFSCTPGKRPVWLQENRLVDPHLEVEAR
jgi:hypothetical protein